MVAGWFPLREFLVIADIAYIGKALLKNRAKNVQALGPICWKAALYEVEAQPVRGQRYGARLPTPAAMLADDQQWAAQVMRTAIAAARPALSETCNAPTDARGRYDN